MKDLFTLHTRPFAYDAESDGGGATTDEDIKKVVGAVNEMTEHQKKFKSEIEATHDKMAEIQADMSADSEKLTAEVKAMKAKLSGMYGQSGAMDFLHEFSKFVKLCYMHGHGKKIPDNMSLSNGTKIDDLINETKAAVTFDTVTDATAGYLVPDMFVPGIIELRDLYGTLESRLTKMTVPAGTTVKISTDAVNPVATWGGGQPETVTHEATPMSFGQLTILTELLGCYVTITNELLSSPGVNFGTVATLRLLKAINRKLEASVIKGVAATAGPSNGFTVDGTDQGNIATATFANVVTFIQACITDNAFASNPVANALFMHPTDVMSLATQAVGASELTGMLVWGNPRTGAPTTLLGYEVIAHPDCNDGTNRVIALGDPSTILLGNDASYTVDVNPYAGTPYLANSSYLRAFNHYDWIIGQTAEWHWSTIGAS